MSDLIVVVDTPGYLAKARRVMSEAECAAVVDMVARDPSCGAVIRGTGGLRKARVPLAGRGKRGGGRVIYWYHSPGYPAVLLWVFAKNEASDLTADQQKALSRAAAGLLDDFGAQR